MACRRCKHLKDVENLDRIYTVKTCACGRKIKLRRPGGNGIGLKIEADERVVIPAGAIRLSANPLKSSGQLSREGIPWFAQLVFVGGLDEKDSLKNIEKHLDQLRNENERILRNSPHLAHIDFEADGAGDAVFEFLKSRPQSLEWWALMSSLCYATVSQSIAQKDAKQAAWAMAIAERFRAMTAFREHFEDVVNMGHSARKLIELLDLWEENKTNAKEEFWQQLLAAHAFALNQLFAAPMTVIRGKAHLGGKILEGTDERLLDFLLSGAISSEAVLLEIKTPVSLLLSRKYRANAYPPSTELSGAVVQVADYCEVFKKNLLEINSRRHHEERKGLSALNPKRVILMGNYEAEFEGDEKKRASFELIRNQYRDVEIVTFDEFFKKVEALAELFSIGRRSPTTQ